MTTNGTVTMEDQTQPPAQYPSEYIEKVTLRSGETITIRPILPEDASRLQVTFRKLSPETIFLRFLETFKELSDKQAQHFANVDYITHMALVGTIQEDGDEQVIAVARYALLSEIDPDYAEAAIVVRDDYQKRGLGTIIMERLIRYARAHSVKAFVATVHSSNSRIRHFIQGSGLPFKRTMVEPGIWEIRVFLEDTPAAH